MNIDKELFEKLRFEIEGSFYDLDGYGDDDEDNVTARADMALNNILVELKNNKFKIIKDE